MKPKTKGAKSSGKTEGQPVAVVVGARRDIGAALVKTLSSRGYFVIAECGKYTAEKLAKHEGVCCVRGLDMSNPKGVEKLRSVVGADTIVDLLIVNAGADPMMDMGMSSENLLTYLTNSHQAFVLAPTLAVHGLEQQLRSGAKVGIFCSTSGSFASMAPSSQQMFMPGHSLNNMAAMSALESVVMHLEAWLKSRNATLSFVHPGIMHEKLFSGASAHEIESRGNVYGMVLTEEECAEMCLQHVLAAERQSPSVPVTPSDAPGSTVSTNPKLKRTITIEIPEDIAATAAPIEAEVVPSDADHASSPAEAKEMPHDSDQVQPSKTSLTSTDSSDVHQCPEDEPTTRDVSPAIAPAASSSSHHKSDDDGVLETAAELPSVPVEPPCASSMDTSAMLTSNIAVPASA